MVNNNNKGRSVEINQPFNLGCMWNADMTQTYELTQTQIQSGY